LEKINENMNEIELKPCPFCGCEAVIDEISSYDELRDIDYTVECSDPVCVARECGNARFGAKEFAIEAWNRRAKESTIAAQAAEIKRLREVMEHVDSLCDGGPNLDSYSALSEIQTIVNEAMAQESEVQHG
jgi:hypothetical protein